MVQLFKEWEGKPSHIYKDLNRLWVDYTPVSTVKKHYCEEFNDIEQSESSSKNERSKWFGMPQKDILDAWDKERVLGTTHGTKIHAVIENWIESGFTYKPMSKEERDLIEWFKTFAFNAKVNYNPLFTFAEVATWLDVCSSDRVWTRKVIENTKASTLRDAILATNRVDNVKGLDAWLDIDPNQCACHYLLDVGMAGTIDIKRPTMLLIGDKWSHYAYIDDIKTDKEIKTRGFDGAMMKGVLSHLPDCNSEQYFLQVNLYGFMNWRQTGEKFGGGYIIHIPRENNNYKKAKILSIPRRDKEVIEVIKDFFKLP